MSSRSSSTAWINCLRAIKTRVCFSGIGVYLMTAVPVINTIMILYWYAVLIITIWTDDENFAFYSRQSRSSDASRQLRVKSQCCDDAMHWPLSQRNCSGVHAAVHSKLPALLLGPFYGAIAVPSVTPHALSLLLLLLSWTSHAACAIAIAGVRLATPGDWQCNGGSQ